MFVDEYQDINEAQDRIIEAISREGQEANRFLVGDVKQSIYRFRLANPRIFQRYAAEWQQAAHARTVPLVENFRSRESVLLVNSFFRALMSPENGGVHYDDSARLLFGAERERRQLGRAADQESSVELHLRLKGGKPAAQGAGNAPEQGLDSGGESEANGEAVEDAGGAGAAVVELEDSSGVRSVTSRIKGSSLPAKVRRTISPLRPS